MTSELPVTLEAAASDSKTVTRSDTIKTRNHASRIQVGGDRNWQVACAHRVWWCEDVFRFQGGRHRFRETLYQAECRIQLASNRPITLEEDTVSENQKNT